MEAAGVEPASEKARHEEPTMRIRFEIFDSNLRTGKSGCHLVRLDLGLQLRTEALGLSRKMTLTHRRAGSVAGAAA